jgi:hypothetical protein
VGDTCGKRNISHPSTGAQCNDNGKSLSVVFSKSSENDRGGFEEKAAQCLSDIAAITSRLLVCLSVRGSHSVRGAFEMVDRTRDIVNLRKAARLCRARPGAPEYLEMAETIDRMIHAFTAALEAERARRAAARPCR